MPARPQVYSHQSLTAVRILGTEIARARRARRWTLEETAQRAGISRVTMRRIEQGLPSVGIGTVFEVATLVGVELFGVPASGLPALESRAQERLAVLPARIRQSQEPVHDDF